MRIAMLILLSVSLSASAADMQKREQYSPETHPVRVIVDATGSLNSGPVTTGEDAATLKELEFALQDSRIRVLNEVVSEWQTLSQSSITTPIESTRLLHFPRRDTIVVIRAQTANGQICVASLNSTKTEWSRASTSCK